jgi:ubiquinone/menaquinone biosynthesis C-methylase UbiE
MLGDCLHRAPVLGAGAHHDYVHESSFGIWFLGTETWATHVLRRALDDLERLIGDRRASYPTILDVGCGWGRSFKLLHDRFAPTRLVGIDLNAEMLDATAAEAGRHGLSVELHRSNLSHLPLRDASVDMVLCHQTFHHVVDQEAALRELHRVLKPGALLLFAESTRRYIESWIIRLLFRHPMQVQRTAPEYLAMIRGAGFIIDADSVSYPYLWWSRADFGLFDRWSRPEPRTDDEQTLVNAVAVRL